MRVFCVHFKLATDTLTDEIVKNQGCWVEGFGHGVKINYDTHTVCVPYYKAAPYNISHTKIFLMAIFTLIFFYKFFFMYVYHA